MAGSEKNILNVEITTSLFGIEICKNIEYSSVIYRYIFQVFLGGDWLYRTRKLTKTLLSLDQVSIKHLVGIIKGQYIIEIVSV